jgi:chloramphenicol O-acetyltransferase
MLLLLPYGALQMYQSSQIKPGEIAAHMSGDLKASLYNGMLQEHLSRIEAKKENCAKLNQFLSAWYQSMAARRAFLTNAKPDMIAQYNQEAAAYSAFRDVVNTENAALTKMQNQPYDFGDISNQDFEAYQEQQARRSAVASSTQGSFLQIPGISTN